MVVTSVREMKFEMGTALTPACYIIASRTQHTARALVEGGNMLLPKSNPYVSGEFSIFDTLISLGEEKTHVVLSFDLHFFLVDCLVQHLHDKNILQQVLALEILRSTEQFREQGNVLLKRAGDGALLLAGLFPERALRLNVSSDYFRFMGQAAYASLGARLQVTSQPERGKFYDRVAERFQLLEKVLDAVRVRTTAWELFQRFRVRLQ